MKIALCHFRVGETDGVSLEMDKWKKALENLGHEVIYIAGSAGNCDAEIIPGLHYQLPLNNEIVAQAYEKIRPTWSEEKLKSQLFTLADTIEKALVSIIKAQQVDVIVPNNILSLGWGLPAGIAFSNAIHTSDIKTICHHHDFYWERVLYSNPNHAFINELLNQHFPPPYPNIQHVCINHLAKAELKQRHDLDAHVVPNVFDFDAVHIKKDAFNRRMRTELGIGDNDLVFLQATRVVERKAIETAIDYVAAFKKLESEFVGKPLYNGKIFNADNRIHLVLAGQPESSVYYERLLSYTKEKQVNLIDISHRVAHRRSGSGRNKTYSLWDAYSIADVVTYPSILEGWGNQLLEAIVARLPIACYEYPVFESDIKKYEFSLISFGNRHSIKDDWVKIDEQTLEDAVRHTLKFLKDKDYYSKETEKNYRIAQQELSVTKLQDVLKPIFEDV